MSQYQEIAIDRITESPNNPRQYFDAVKLEELAGSIRQRGILVPVIVRPVNEHFELVAGARRVRAAKLLGLTHVPAVVRECGDAIALEDAITENLQRDNVKPLDEARAIHAALGGTYDLTGVLAIAERIGKPKGYVWDRLRLLELIPDAQELLERDRITVQHATRLARLTPEQQAQVIDPGDGGLFEDERRLWGPDDDSEYDNEDPYCGRKAVSVAELDAWIAGHVRFDVHRAAVVAPLDFGPLAEMVLAATELGGRKKTVVHVTHETYVRPEAKIEGERTYCAQSWKRADGLRGSETCDKSVLGMVVVGPEYGVGYPVCVNKTCEIHWPEAVRAKQQSREAGADPKGSGTQESSWERDQRRRREKEESERKTWDEHVEEIEALVAAAVVKAPVATLAAILMAQHRDSDALARVEKQLPATKTADDVLRRVALADLFRETRMYYAHNNVPAYVKKTLGLDLAAALQGQGAATSATPKKRAAPEKAAVTKKAAPAKKAASKKPAAKKTAKK